MEMGFIRGAGKNPEPSRSAALDIRAGNGYNNTNFIGQFVTILSVNKTRELMGAMRSFFVLWVRTAPIF